MSVIWDVDLDDSELRRLFKAAPQAASLAVQQAMDVVASDLEAEVVEMFPTQGQGSWPDNAQSTIDKKGSSQPMVDSGDLQDSIRASSGPDWAQAATDKNYIRFHLLGGPKIPKRNPFELPAGYEERAAQTVADFVAQALVRV